MVFFGYKRAYVFAAEDFHFFSFMPVTSLSQSSSHVTVRVSRTKLRIQRCAGFATTTDEAKFLTHHRVAIHLYYRNIVSHTHYSTTRATRVGDPYRFIYCKQLLGENVCISVYTRNVRKMDCHRRDPEIFTEIFSLYWCTRYVQRSNFIPIIRDYKSNNGYSTFLNRVLYFIQI